MALTPDEEAAKRKAELAARREAELTARTIEMTLAVEKAAGGPKKDTPITDDNVRRVVRNPEQAVPADVQRWAAGHSQIMEREVKIDRTTRVAAYGPGLRPPVAGLAPDAPPQHFDPSKPTAIVLLGPDSFKPGEAGAVAMATRGMMEAARRASGNNTVFIDINGMSQAQIKEAIERQAAQIYGSVDNARGRIGVHVVAHGDENGNYLASVGPDGRAASAPIERILGAVRDGSAAPLVTHINIANCHMGIRGNMVMGPNQVLTANSTVEERTKVVDFLRSFSRAAARHDSIMPQHTAAEYFRMGHTTQRSIIRNGRIERLDGNSGDALAADLEGRSREVAGRIVVPPVVAAGVIPGEERRVNIGTVTPIVVGKEVAEAAVKAGEPVRKEMAELEGEPITPDRRVVAEQREQGAARSATA